jgi:NADH-quinone oxidoreductase subunit L
MYIKNTKLASDIAKMNKPLYEFLLNKWYFDELYNFLLVRPAIAIGKILWKFLDEYIIDGFGPNGIASLAINLSNRAKKIQSGYIYHYAFAILIGLSLLMTFFIFKF